MTMNSLDIKKSSPLYEYWESDQNLQAEQERLSKRNPGNPLSILFEEEPYKWEILYQSAVQEISKSGFDSIFSLQILLDMLNKNERDKVLEYLERSQIFDINIIKKIDLVNNTERKANPIRFIKILCAIFSNPYNIRIKGKSKYIYEFTARLCVNIRTFFS